MGRDILVDAGGRWMSVSNLPVVCNCVLCLTGIPCRGIPYPLPRLTGIPCKGIPYPVPCAAGDGAQVIMNLYWISSYVIWMTNCGIRVIIYNMYVIDRGCYQNLLYFHYPFAQ